MNKEISRFMEDVCEEIKYKKIHSEIEKELSSHLEDSIEEYKLEGYSEDEAIKQTICNMGDATTIGAELNRIHRPKLEWSIVGTIATLLIISSWILFIIQGDSYARAGDFLFIRNIIHTMLGIVIMTIFYFFDYTKLEKYSMHMFIFTIVATLVTNRYAEYGIVNSYNGVYMFSIPGISMSTAALYMPMFLIAYAGIINGVKDGSLKDIVKLLVLGVISIAILISHAPASQALLMMGGYAVLITIAIIDNKFIMDKKKMLISLYGGGLCSCIAVVYILIVKSPYFLMRIVTMFNPEEYSKTFGYILYNVKKIVTTSSFVGASPNMYIKNNGILVLPDVSTDFVLTYIIGKYGWLVGISIITLLIIMVVRMFSATSKINSGYGRLVSLAIATIFSMEIIAATLMNVGLFMHMAYTIPFLSYENGSKIMNMALLGLYLGVYRRKDIMITQSKC